jgi:hypothetical protein
MNYPEMRQITEYQSQFAVGNVCVTNRKKFMDFGCVNSFVKITN